MKHYFHPEARTEFLESIRYYEAQRPGLGQRFLGPIRETIRRIQDRPSMYRVVSETRRQCRVPRFPFGIIYRTENHRIEIIAVMHPHRKPGYWRDRSMTRHP
jgi:plasmid stabilization system protein ParE